MKNMATNYKVFPLHLSNLKAAQFPVPSFLKDDISDDNNTSLNNYCVLK